MRKIVTIALFLTTIVTSSLNADKADQKPSKVLCNDGTIKGLRHQQGVPASIICAAHRGVSKLVY